MWNNPQNIPQEDQGLVIGIPVSIQLQDFPSGYPQGQPNQQQLMYSQIPHQSYYLPQQQQQQQPTNFNQQQFQIPQQQQGQYQVGSIPQQQQGQYQVNGVIYSNQQNPQFSTYPNHNQFFYQQQTQILQPPIAPPAAQDSRVEFPNQINVNNNSNPNKESVKEAEYLIHDVKFTDTLLGLSIQYGVSEFRIRQANDLDSDQIYYKKTLRIPNPKCNIESNVQIDPLQAQQDQAIFFFMTKVLKGKDQSRRVAKIYLEAADWDIAQAEADYKDDVDLEGPQQPIQQKKKI